MRAAYTYSVILQVLQVSLKTMLENSTKTVVYIKKRRFHRHKSKLVRFLSCQELMIILYTVSIKT